jgi:curli biogenesis system outer membrane secretion channel CsgG
MKREKLKVSLVLLAAVWLTVAFSVQFSTNASHAQAESTKQSKSTSLGCPKCKGSMEQGLVLDYNNQHDPGFSQSEWASDLPKRDFLGKKDRPTKKIVTYRCTSCGYLESYAK